MSGLGNFGRGRVQHRGFTAVPNSLIRARDLKIELKMLLILLRCLSWRDGSCNLSQDRIAAELGIDPRTVRRYLQLLVDAGIVVVIRSGNRNRYAVELSRFEDKNAPSAASCAGRNATMEEGGNAPIDGADLLSIQTERNKDATTTSSCQPRNAEEKRVRAALVIAGVNEPALSTLARCCTLADVENQIDWMQYRSGIRNASSALISALMEKWAEPEAASRAREASEARRARSDLATAARAIVEGIGVVHSTTDDLWKLPSMERHLLCDRARRELGGDAAASLYGDDEFAEMCRKYALHLLDRRKVG